MAPNAPYAFSFAPTITSFLRRPSPIFHRPSSLPSSPAIILPRFRPKCTATQYKGAKANALRASSEGTTPPTFQEALFRLQQYWSSKGCLVWHPYNHELGAGTMNPATFLRVLGPEPWAVAYEEPSIRPDDSRYAENPNRLQRHTQFQVIIKPAPDCAQELVVGSYHALGIDTRKHDIRFVEDNWESPALGAWGLGWEVWLDGMEVTQFTYFQQAGGMPLDSIAVEITYGLERIIMALQGKTHFKDIIFSPGLTYGDIFAESEREMSIYNLDVADIARNSQMFDLYEAEANMLLEKRLPVPAYNYVLKASHTFNILDARGAIGVTERARYFQRMRVLARNAAKLWIERREEDGFSLLRSSPALQSASKTPAPVFSEIETPEADLVLEIGVEELPPSDLRSGIAQVQKLLSAILSEAQLSFSSIDINGTPRRITAYVRDLQTRQKDEVRRIRGPSLRAALKDGQPTKAATGFMRSQGVSNENCIEYNEEEGYMYANVQNVGLSAVEVLGKAFPVSLLPKIMFQKTMRWDESSVSFSRPIRWLLCMLGDRVVPFTYGGVGSGNTTRSLRGFDGFATRMPIKSASEYHHVLSESQIILSREHRASSIRDEAIKLAAEIKGTVSPKYLESELFNEVIDLVENPIPLRGRFDTEFLDLPAEVLITVMRKHQRYFPVVDPSNGALLNGFITVANGDKNLVDIETIRKGNEAVLSARYSDAAFFYKKDTQDKRLEDFIPNLAGLTFQESLGSMLDKVGRVKYLTPKLCEAISVSKADFDTALRAAALYKADLATSMVVEMTSLAGTMGRHYALKSGEHSVDVADAIFEATLPRFSGDKLASSNAGAIVSVADRIDSIVSLFAVGLIPKSTADPFALRRAALGVVQTLMERSFDVNIGEVTRIAAGIISKETDVLVSPKCIELVIDFICKRLEYYLLDVLRFPDDVVKAVLAIPANAQNSVAAVRLCQSLVDFQTQSSQRLSTAEKTYSRAFRLLKSVKDLSFQELCETHIREDLFEGGEERLLWTALKELEDRNTTGTLSYNVIVSEKIEKLCDIEAAVDAFFDNVFVNSKDEAVRKNRLALCARIVNILSGLFDMALLNTI